MSGLPDLEFQIARLELEPGDILVVKTDLPASNIQWRSIMPAGVRVLIISTDVELSVLTRAEIEAKAI